MVSGLVLFWILFGVIGYVVTDRSVRIEIHRLTPGWGYEKAVEMVDRRWYSSVLKGARVAVLTFSASATLLEFQGRSGDALSAVGYISLVAGVLMSLWYAHRWEEPAPDRGEPRRLTHRVFTYQRKESSDGVDSESG